jgi:hypothetical protein
MPKLEGHTTLQKGKGMLVKIFGFYEAKNRAFGFPFSTLCNRNDSVNKITT